MTDPKLKACPFCGGETISENFIIEAHVRCHDCGAKIARPHSAKKDIGIKTAIAAWNKRTPPPIDEAAARESFEKWFATIDSDKFRYDKGEFEFVWLAAKSNSGVG